MKMKPLLLKFPVTLLLLLLIAGTSNSQLLNKKEFRLKDTKTELIELSQSKVLVSRGSLWKDKSMLLSGSLSFIIPGAALGQFYKEEFVNGAIRLGISGICVLWFLLSPPISITGDGRSSPQKLYATALFTANWIASVVDAFIPSKKINNSKYSKYKLSH